jgi:hypothetical protein
MDQVWFYIFFYIGESVILCFQKQTQLKALHKQTFVNFNSLLTDEQRDKWRSMRTERKNNKNDQQQNEAMEEEIMSLPAN